MYTQLNNNFDIVGQYSSLNFSVDELHLKVKIN